MEIVIQQMLPESKNQILPCSAEFGMHQKYKFSAFPALWRRKGPIFLPPIKNKHLGGSQNPGTGSSPTPWIYFIVRNPLITVLSEITARERMGTKK